MLAAVPAVRVPERPGKARSAVVDRRSRSAVEAFKQSGLERTLATGEVLFRAGERKTHVYRVEAGVVCGYWQQPAGGRRDVGFSFVGDVVGLGGLDKHVVTAEANAETVVQCLPRADLDDLMIADGRLAARHGDATEVEMALLKEGLVAQGRANTLERVAALLTVLSFNNCPEGRQADLISDDITCGFVADQLGLEVGTLEQALLGLGRLGLIEPQPGGALRLRDRRALERLAEGRA